MNYTIAKWNMEQRNGAFRFYMTDVVYYYTHGNMLRDRFYDILYPAAVDNRSAEDIIGDVIRKAGLKVV